VRTEELKNISAQPDCNLVIILPGVCNVPWRANFHALCNCRSNGRFVITYCRICIEIFSLIHIHSSATINNYRDFLYQITLIASRHSFYLTAWNYLVKVALNISYIGFLPLFQARSSSKKKYSPLEMQLLQTTKSC